jgi:hypothetical protein
MITFLANRWCLAIEVSEQGEARRGRGVEGLEGGNSYRTAVRPVEIALMQLYIT